MKFSLFAFALFSTTVFAIGTNELTGTFEDVKSVPSVESHTSYLTGASFSHSVDKSRLPTSVQKDKKSALDVNELTGTFE